MDTAYATTLVLSGIVGLLTLIYLWTRRPPGFPPGPSFFPGLGTAAYVSVPSCNTDIITLLNGWKRQYGKVCGYSTGARFAAVINDYGIAKEVFIRDGKHVSDRARIGVPHLKETNPYFPKTGILGGDFTDDKWRPLHRACQMALHELVDVPPKGNCTSRLEGRLARPLDSLLGNVERHLTRTTKNGGDVNVPFMTFVTEFILVVIFGGENREITRRAQQLVKLREPLTQLNTDHLHMKHNRLYRFVNKVTGASKALLESYKQFHSFLFSEVGEHQTRLEKKDQLQPRNFIDYYLKECEASSVGSDDRLFLVLAELLDHGVDPLVSSLVCVMHFLVCRPHLQQEIQQRLDMAVGSKRQPKLKDRGNLGLIDAVISETLRLAAPYVVGEAHRNSAKIEADGYLLPENTIVYLNIWQVHRDPTIWPDPTEFNPERFLNTSGRFVNKPEMIAFGMGRRVCVGEQMSRQVLFLTIANLLHKFTFLPPDSDSAPSSGEEAPRHTTTYQPPPFNVKVIRRK